MEEGLESVGFGAQGGPPYHGIRLVDGSFISKDCVNGNRRGLGPYQLGGVL